MTVLEAIIEMHVKSEWNRDLADAWSASQSRIQNKVHLALIEQLGFTIMSVVLSHRFLALSMVQPQHTTIQNLDLTGVTSTQVFSSLLVACRPASSHTREKAMSRCAQRNRNMFVHGNVRSVVAKEVIVDRQSNSNRIDLTAQLMDVAQKRS